MADKFKRMVVDVAMEEDGGNVVEYTVQTDNRDMLAYERMRAREGWPKTEEGLFTFMTFIAWSAMHRAGDTTLGMREFMEDRCVYAHAKNPEDGQEDVDPTQKDRGTGS